MCFHTIFREKFSHHFFTRNFSKVSVFNMRQLNIFVCVLRTNFIVYIKNLFNFCRVLFRSFSIHFVTRILSCHVWDFFEKNRHNNILYFSNRCVIVFIFFILYFFLYSRNNLIDFIKIWHSNLNPCRNNSIPDFIRIKIINSTVFLPYLNNNHLLTNLFLCKRIASRRIR